MGRGTKTQGSTETPEMQGIEILRESERVELDPQNYISPIVANPELLPEFIDYALSQFSDPWTNIRHQQLFHSLGENLANHSLWSLNGSFTSMQGLEQESIEEISNSVKNILKDADLENVARTFLLEKIAQLIFQQNHPDNRLKMITIFSRILENKCFMDTDRYPVLGYLLAEKYVEWLLNQRSNENTADSTPLYIKINKEYPPEKVIVGIPHNGFYDQIFCNNSHSTNSKRFNRILYRKSGTPVIDFFDALVRFNKESGSNLTKPFIKNLIKNIKQVLHDAVADPKYTNPLSVILGRVGLGNLEGTGLEVEII